MKDKREVQQEEGIALALSNQYKFKETSALKNENVADAFEALIELWNIEYHKNKLKPKEDNISLDTNKKNHKKRNCC